MKAEIKFDSGYLVSTEYFSLAAGVPIRRIEKSPMGWQESDSEIKIITTTGSVVVKKKKDLNGFYNVFKILPFRDLQVGYYFSLSDGDYYELEASKGVLCTVVLADGMLLVFDKTKQKKLIAVVVPREKEVVLISV